MHYFRDILGFLATVIALTGNTWTPEKRWPRRITWRGYSAISIAIATLVLSWFLTHQEANSLSLSNVRYTLRAIYPSPFVNDSIILSITPSSFAIPDVFIGDFRGRCDFLRSGTVERPPGRANRMATVTYISTQVENSNYLNGINFPYTMTSELNGTFQCFVIPTTQFKQIRDDEPWHFTATMVVGDKLVSGNVDEKGVATFPIDDF